MRLLLFCLLLAGCTGTAEAPPAGPAVDRTVTGRVVAVDLSPMAYDGDALVDVQPDSGGAPVKVHVPARQNLCVASIDALDAVVPGDRVEVRGAGGEGIVTPCEGEDHVFRVTERAEPRAGTFRGVFEAGFETSAFRPCDRPGETWWLLSDEAFFDQFDAIRQREAPDGGRGLRLFVEATVVGTLSDAGQFGHLGQYARQLTVTETRDMVYLGRDLDALPSCR
ncbi:hypothetical protein [Rubrivirga sp.]|uniref:hypothetical protein n=1 Tax=Rubrivirga sp. TaxID=1885344 RepID=UPI003B51AAE3